MRRAALLESPFDAKVVGCKLVLEPACPPCLKRAKVKRNPLPSTVITPRAV